MKKIYILLVTAIVAAIVLPSCQRETGNARSESDEMKTLVISSSDFTTKSGADDDQVLLTDMPYITSSNDTLYISATISDMEEVQMEADVTKGAPITSSLFGTYGDYTEFITRVFTDEGTTYTDVFGNSMSAVTTSFADGKWSFDTRYYWPGTDEDLYFIGLAPKKKWTDYDIYARENWDNTAKTYTFSYASYHGTPSGTDIALDQHDFLVAFNKQNRNSDNSQVNLSFRHALTGVKFIMGGSIYGKVESLGLTEVFKDANFTLGENSITTSHFGANKEGNFIQSFEFDTSCHNEGDSMDDDSDKARTFMIIPQRMATVGSDVRKDYLDHQVSDVSLYIKMEGLEAETISFSVLSDSSNGGDAKLADWTDYAGKMITFKINDAKSANVAVTVDDTMEGNVKKDITITNDSGRPVYIRASIVGNWLSSAEKYLQAWSETEPYGTFDNAFPATLPSNWKKGTDGYYYYSRIVRPAQTVKQNLFNTYTLTGHPDLTSIAYLDLNIHVQAVAVGKQGSETSYAQAIWGLSSSEAGELLSTTED